MGEPEQRAYLRRKLLRESLETTHISISVDSQGQQYEGQRQLEVPPGKLGGNIGEKSSASDVTPVSSSSFASSGGQPPNNNGWKIAAAVAVAGGVAAVAGGPIIASAAFVGGVVWAIGLFNFEVHNV